MDNSYIDFILPIGYEDEKGIFHRHGKMRSATALDEIEINNDEKNKFNQRYHDLLLFSRVITSLGELPSINVEVIENLYEVDFRYLQALYNEINGDLNLETETRCPECSSVNNIALSKAYENLEFFYSKKSMDNSTEQ